MWILSSRISNLRKIPSPKKRELGGNTVLHIILSKAMFQKSNFQGRNLFGNVSLYSNLFIFGHIFVTFWTSVIWSPKFGMCHHHHSWKTFMYSEREIVLYLKMQIYYSNCHIRSTLFIFTLEIILYFPWKCTKTFQIIANFKNLRKNLITFHIYTM